MTRIAKNSSHLLDRYGDGLRAKITALATALESLDKGEEEAIAAIRRIAHQLQGSGANLGLSEIARAAAQAELAPPSDLAGATRILLSLLEETSHPEATPAELLLVEDSPVLIELLTRALSSPSCVIHSARTAADAKKLLNEQTFDLVILDLILPDEDGRNLLMFMQDRVATAAIPVIVLSARGGTQTKTECLALGAEQFFEKPFDKVFISAVATMIQRQRRRAAQAREDLLTGLPNRARFREVFERTVEQSRAGQRPIALAIVDVDGFDSINETYGHAHGDELLRRIGLFLYGELRHTDVIARWGGDEFAIVFPNQSAERTALVLRRIQESLRIQDGLSLGDGRRVHISFSSGVVDVIADEDLDSAMARADQLLYLAKATGRDQVLNAVPAAATQVHAKLLLVEADPQVGILLTELLQEQRFEVTWCESGESALESALDQPYHLAVVEKKLPTMDGFKLLEHLRARSDYRDIPILVITTMGSKTEIEEAFELGADDYVQTPFRCRELVTRIRRLLTRSGFAQSKEAHYDSANPPSPA